MKSSTKITDLPLEVLVSIFKNLPCLEDQLCLALVHPHIKAAFCCHSTQRMKDIDTCELSLKDWSELLQICGSSVKHVTGLNMFNDTMSKLVIQHCLKLQSIALKVTSNNINAIKTMLDGVKSLRCIFLYNDTMSNHLGIIELLKFQPNLRMLHLMKFGGDELLEVRNLITLEELRIISNEDEYLNIYELCSRLKELRSLNIQSVYFTLSNESEGVFCPALRSLTLHESLVLDPSPPDILKWILRHADTLEELQFNLRFGYAPDKDACEILAKCKHLRYLNMKIDKAGADFAHKLIKIVSENGVTSEERPLKLTFNNQIHDQIRKVMVNTPAEQLIILN